MSYSSNLPKLNKFEDPKALKDLIGIIFDSSANKNKHDTQQKVEEFAQAQGIANVNALNSLIKDLDTIPKSTVKKNFTSAQLKEELLKEGLGENQAAAFAEVYSDRVASLRALAIESTLAVSQLVDLQWKFGVTAASSDMQLVGNTFLQMKWTIRGNKDGQLETMCTELSLPQFYKFLHEMEKAKTSMEMLG